MLEKNNFKYEIKRKKNCKHIIIKVIHGDIKISAPLYTPEYEITKFIQSKKQWISKQLSQSGNKPQNIEQLHELLLFGEIHNIVYYKEQRKNIRIILVEDVKEIHILLPNDEFKSSEQIQNAIKNFLRKQAALYFETCLLDLRARQEVYLIIDRFLLNWRTRFMKSAFGLCYAGRGEIVLNTELVMYDVKYVNYVILHELSHFYHQDHSTAFYKVFSALEPNWKQLKKELNSLHQVNGGWSYV